MNSISEYSDYLRFYMDRLDKMSKEELSFESLLFTRTKENRIILTYILSLMASKVKKSKSTKEFKYDQQMVETRLYQSITQDYNLIRSN